MKLGLMGAVFAVVNCELREMFKDMMVRHT